MKNLKSLILVGVCFSSVGWTASKGGEFELGRTHFEQGNYARALGHLDRAIRSATTKMQKVQAFYFQGLVLFELGHYYSSYVSFRNVLSVSDPSLKQYYEKSIKNAVIITDRLSMVDRVGKVLSRLPENYIAPSVAHMANYAMGVYAHSQNNLAKADSYFKSVNPDSQFYLKSLFYLGVLATEKKDYKDAAFYFDKIQKLTQGQRRDQEIRELAKLNLARTVYSVGKVESAIGMYSRFANSSPYWIDILFEASWALMRVNDTTISLGNLRTLLSPFYREDMMGEAYILRATVLFSLCKYEEMRRTLAQFFEIYDPVLRDMQKESRTLSESGGYFRGMMEGKGINRSFAGYANRDPGIVKSMKVRQMLQEERLLLAKYSQNVQMKKMRKLLTREESQIERDLDGVLAKLHKRKLDDLVEQREQANYLKVEMVTGEKDLVQKQGGLPPKRIVDVKTSVAKDYNYYPFRGEYWDDEAGSFVYTTASSCVE